MIKHIHMTFVLLSFISFTGRMILSEINPFALKQKWLKITPHVIDTILLLSGVILAVKGAWFSTDYSWIIAKIVVLLAYIGLGIVAMRSQGKFRWLAFIGAIGCFTYIAAIAVTKQVYGF